MTIVLGFVLAMGMVLYIGYPLFVRGGVVDDEAVNEGAADEIERAVAARRSRGKAKGRHQASVARAEAGGTRACPSCGSARAPEDRFCAGCGVALDNRCPACGAAHEDDDRFCAACGLALAAE